MGLYTRLRAAFLVFCLSASWAVAAPQKAYVNDDLASSAARLEQKLADDSADLRAATPLTDLRQQAAAAIATGDIIKSLPLLAAVAAAAPGNSDDWLAYARAARAAAGVKGQDAQALNNQALAAAYDAYRHARDKADEATALTLIGQIFAWNRDWRPALNAYRASLDAAANPAVQKTYADLRVKYGFRVLNYKVDNESARPRVCFQFSEDLARNLTDFSPFVALAGRSDAAVSNEERQICVEGLKHGERYSIVLRQGLPSQVGEKLLKDLKYDIYVRDRSPQAHFTGRNYVLPRVGPEGVPVVSVNTTKVKIDVYRIGDRNLQPTLRSNDFLSQLSAYRLRQFAASDGQKVWSGTLAVKSELNKDVVTDFPALEALGQPKPGVYVMTARAADDLQASDNDYGQRATQWFVISDLGLTALSGRDGISVLIRSLATAAPKAGVNVRLIAKNNDLLATEKTDAAGEAHFAPGLSRGAGGEAPGLVVASDGKADYNFLDLQQTAFDLTDRGVKGRAAPKALDAFVYAERGVYRSGEKVHLAAILRDSAGVAASAPLTLVVKRPDGVEFKRVALPDQGLGGRALDLTLPEGAMPGGWTVQAFADPKSPAIGETHFLVEDYVPERMDMVLTPKVAAIRAGETAQIAAKVRYLYGAPGAHLTISGEVQVEAAEDHGLPALKGYEAGVSDEGFAGVQSEIEQSATTDAQGAAIVDVPIPLVRATRPLEAKITLRAGEVGGRAIERVAYLPLLPPGGMIGVKKTFSGTLSAGDRATFEAIAIDRDGKRTTRRNVHWSLYQINNDYQWYRQDGRWNFEQVKSSRRVAEGNVDLTPQATAKISALVGLGQYRLDLRDDDPSDAQTSVAFNVGWSGGATAETPDLLDVTLDKQAYATGESIKMKITARAASKATLAIVGDGVKKIMEVDLAKGDNKISLPVDPHWGVGAYALVLAHRPLDKAAGRMPGRAIGLAWFAINPAAHRLDIALNAPAKARPREKLELPIEVKGLAPGEEAYITVAAVDVGILNLTHYQTPDPRAYFFGQRLLGTEVRDIYGYLIDGLQASRGAIHVGGGEGGPETTAEKPTQKPLALYSGIVRVGPDGKAKVSFDMPSFNGTARIMAVAWSKTRTGSAQADVIVRDPVVAQASLPRFLALGDRSRLNLRLDNVEGAAGLYKVTLALDGPIATEEGDLQKDVRLAAGASASLDIPLRATGVGPATIGVTLTGPDFESTQTLALNVEAGTSELVQRSIHPLQPGESLSLSRALLADFVPGTGAVSVTAAPLAGVDVAGLIQALDAYPFGCSEQTVSRALPLLYLSRLGDLGLVAPADVTKRVNNAIAVLLSRQDSSGNFGLWSAGSAEDLWLDAFVADFLTRARENKYFVPQSAMDQALDRLRNFVVNVSTVNKDNSAALAYAVYVLARNGRPVIGDLRYLADAKIQAFATPLSRAQIAAALYLLGDRARANKIFASAASVLQRPTKSVTSRADYGSLLRDGAGLLALASESKASPSVIVKAAQVVERQSAATAHASTQEETWMVLAAQAMAGEAEKQALTIDGAPHKGLYSARFAGAALASEPVVIANKGQNPIRLALTVSGRPLLPEPAVEHGYKIERGFYRLDGTPVDPNALKQNERIVVALKITETEAAYARLLLVDRLPAGLEIENPALFDGGSADNLAWVKATVEPTHTEYRDDRFVAAFQRSGSDKATFAVAYVVRAVTPGKYVLPPATIEDMYRPERFGRTAFGAVTISGSARK